MIAKFEASATHESVAKIIYALEYKRNGVKIITISWLFNTYTCEVNYEAFAQLKEAVNIR